MKYIYLLLLLVVIANYTVAQETKDTATVDFFVSTNESDLQSKIKNSEKKYKIVWIFCYYCYASQVNFPKVIEYLNGRDDIDFFAICDNEHIDEKAIQYLTKESYKGSIYILSKKKKKKLISIRSLKYIESVLKNICLSCDYKKMGASDYVIFNKENDVIAYTTYEVNDIEYFKILENLSK